MSFYSISKEERIKRVASISSDVLYNFQSHTHDQILAYFNDEDTYIRKSAYLSVGRIYNDHSDLQSSIIQQLNFLLLDDRFKVRQTVINAAGEIGKKDFAVVKHFFDKGLFDEHHSSRNAVIGSIKKMGEVNPKPILSWAKEYLHHPDKEIRREICHGIELRGRKYPQDILPLLMELQHDKTARVRNTLVHVLGQIAYKKGCLQTVIEHLKQWKNTALVNEALAEIIIIHDRYRNFSVFTPDEAKQYIAENYYV